MRLLVRPALLGRADDGAPIVLGMGGADSSWPDREFESLRADLDCVLNFMANEPLFVADTSGKRLLELIANAEAAAIDQPSADLGLVEILIHLYAFLSTMRAFVDQGDRELKIKFGSQSIQRARFKDALAQVYDSSSEYQFLYALRNYAQHRSVTADTDALGSIQIGGSRN